MGRGVGAATEIAAPRRGLSLDTSALIEVNEAVRRSLWRSRKELGLDREKGVKT